MDRQSLSAIDDELAILSLKTAQEVDRGLAGRQLNKTVLSEFGAKLSAASGVNGPNESVNLFSDPETTDIFHRAAEEARSTSILNIDSLRQSLQEVIQSLTDVNEFTESRLKEVKLFSLAFHRSLAAHRAPGLFERESPFDDAMGIYR